MRKCSYNRDLHLIGLSLILIFGAFLSFPLLIVAQGGGLDQYFNDIPTKDIISDPINWNVGTPNITCAEDRKTANHGGVCRYTISISPASIGKLNTMSFIVGFYNAVTNQYTDVAAPWRLYGRIWPATLPTTVTDSLSWRFDLGFPVLIEPVGEWEGGTYFLVKYEVDPDTIGFNAGGSIADFEFENGATYYLVVGFDSPPASSVVFPRVQHSQGLGEVVNPIPDYLYLLFFQQFWLISDLVPSSEYYAARVGTVPLSVLLGDLNEDGVVNLLDVQPFVDLLITGGFHVAGDINGDGQVNLLDVQGFVDILTGV